MHRRARVSRSRQTRGLKPFYLNSLSAILKKFSLACFSSEKLYLFCPRCFLFMFRCLIYKVHPVLADSFLILPPHALFVKKFFQNPGKILRFIPPSPQTFF